MADRLTLLENISSVTSLNWKIYFVLKRILAHVRFFSPWLTGKFIVKITTLQAQ